MTETEELELLRLRKRKALAAQAAPAEATPAPEAPGPAPLDRMTALGRGAGQGATFGFGDEINGLIQALGEKYLPEKRGGGGPQARAKSLGELYRANRDSFRTENAAAQSAHGGMYLGGNVAGGLAPGILMPAVRLAKGAPLAYRMLAGLASGIPAGMAYGAGASSADLTSGRTEDVDRFVGDTQLGGVMGGGAGGFMPLPAAALSSVPSTLRAGGIAAGRRALTNGADSLSTRNALGADAVEEAIKQHAIRPGGTTEGAHQRLLGLVNAKEAAHGELVQQLEGAGIEGANVRGIADTLQGKAERLAIENPLNPALAREYESAANRIMDSVGRANESGQAASAARLPLSQAEAVKRGAQELARYGRFEETPLNEVRRDIASILRQSNEDAITEQAGKAPELASAFVPSKRTLGNLLEAEAAAQRGMARGAQRGHFSLYDIMAGLTGFGHGGGGLSGVLKGAGAAGLMHLARTRGPSSAASGLYWAGRGLGALGGSGEATLAALARLRPQTGASLVGEELLGPRLNLNPAMADRDSPFSGALALRSSR